MKRARALGFGMAAIGKVVALWNDWRRKSSQVKRLAMEHVTELERRIVKLEERRATLLQLARHCRGGHRPECPVLDEPATGEPS